ncbi:hypothetical protein D9M72_480070 [compost metagenome]
MSLNAIRWSSSMKNTVHLAAAISSLTWFSPRLPYRPLFSFSRCASSTISTSNWSPGVSMKPPEPVKRFE